MPATLMKFLKEGNKENRTNSNKEPRIAEPLIIDDSLILRCKWRNKVFKLYDLCCYTARCNQIFLLKISEIGMDIQGIDSSHSERIEIHLDSKDFSFYNYFLKEPMKIPLNFEELSRKLKRFINSYDSISIQITKKDWPERIVRFESHEIYFAQKISEIDLEETPMPIMNYIGEYLVNLPKLLEILEFAVDYTDFIEFNNHKGGNLITIQGEGKDGTKFHRDLKSTGNYLQRNNSQIYSVQLLLEVLKKMPFNDARLEFATGLPMRIILNISSSSTIKALVAPYIKDEKNNGGSPR